MNSSMFANCSVFCDVREVRSSVLVKKEMFGEVRSSVLMFGELSEHLEAVKRPIFCQEINKYLKYIWKFFLRRAKLDSCWVITNFWGPIFCSHFFQSHFFLLIIFVRAIFSFFGFAEKFDVRSCLFEVRSQNLGIMFEVFEVRCVKVWGVRSSVFWCSFQDYERPQSFIEKCCRKILS